MSTSKDLLTLAALEENFPDEVKVIRDKIDEMELTSLRADVKGATLQALASAVKHRIAMLQIASSFDSLTDVMDIVDKITRAKRAGVLADKDAAKITRELNNRATAGGKDLRMMDALTQAFPEAVPEIMDCIHTLEEQACAERPRGAVLQTLAAGVKNRIMMLKAAAEYNPAKNIMNNIDRVTRAKRAGTMTERDAISTVADLMKTL